MHKLLIKRKLSVAVAESCTGGLLSKLLTDFAGSSSYFLMGVVAYHNEAKGTALHIPSSLITKRGAVSKEVALAMATRVQKIAGADLGVGITGIAGPSGAATGKPVGTVFIAVAAKKRTSYGRFHFTGTRRTIRIRAARAALKLLDSSLRMTKYRSLRTKNYRCAHLSP